MFNTLRRGWLLDALDQSSLMDRFLESCKVDLEDHDEIINSIEQGLKGDPEYHACAVRHLGTVEGHRALGYEYNSIATADLIARAPFAISRADALLLKSLGIDIVYAMALLHSFGPYSQTGDFSDDELDNVRGLLTFSSASTKKTNITLSLVFTKMRWEMLTNIKLSDCVRWESDFRGGMQSDYRYERNSDLPNIQIEDREIPESLLARMPGDLLKNHVSHPVLDPLSMIIDTVEKHDDDYNLYVRGGEDMLKLSDII